MIAVEASFRPTSNPCSTEPDSDRAAVGALRVLLRPERVGDCRPTLTIGAASLSLSHCGPSRGLTRGAGGSTIPAEWLRFDRSLSARADADRSPHSWIFRTDEAGTGQRGQYDAPPETGEPRVRMSGRRRRSNRRPCGRMISTQISTPPQAGHRSDGTRAVAVTCVWHSSITRSFAMATSQRISSNGTAQFELRKRSDAPCENDSAVRAPCNDA